MAVKEASIAFTSQGKDGAFHIHTHDVESDPLVSAGGKTRHVWHYHNEGALTLEPEAVTEIADLPHVAVTTLESWSDVGYIYADLFKDRAKATPDISKLASDLTEGVRDRRQQARILYEWVAGHIRYVDIVLGAGGFLPHEAADVLKNGYGDCKDHVMLLEALLSAKGIRSSSVLIRAGVENVYKLPPAPSPFVFDHLITYIPEFSLFVDFTARYGAVRGPSHLRCRQGSADGERRKNRRHAGCHRRQFLDHRGQHRDRQSRRQRRCRNPLRATLAHKPLTCAA